MKNTTVRSASVWAAGLVIATGCSLLEYLKPVEKEKEPSSKEKVVQLLKSLETGDRKPLRYINADKYIQHNLGAADGLAGFEAFLSQLPDSTTANPIRVFGDGEFVFTHGEYNIYGPKVSMDVYRFEKGKMVEHWDNLTSVQPKNPSGRTQTDGETAITDLAQTAANKKLVENFLNDILYAHQNNFTDYINPEKYIQHNPDAADGLEGFGAFLQKLAANGEVMVFEKTHRILGEGNFVLAVSEGRFGKNVPSAFYDLFRIENGKIVEHWDVIESIPPRESWKNNNGKF